MTDKYQLPDSRFDGDDYVPPRDDPRLRTQIQRIFYLMSDGQWRTLSEIEVETNDPASSISAQLRHLRKEKFGSHTVNKRHRGEAVRGWYEYQLIVNRPQQDPPEQARMFE